MSGSSRPTRAIIPLTRLDHDEMRVTASSWGSTRHHEAHNSEQDSDYAGEAVSVGWETAAVRRLGAETPNQRPSAGFRRIQQEALGRLEQVLNGPVGDVVTRDVAEAALKATHEIEVLEDDGPIDLAYDERYVDGMIRWGLAKADLEQGDRDELIETMADMGIGGKTTPVPNNRTRFEPTRFDQRSSAETATDRTEAQSRGYENRDRNPRGI